MSLGAVRPLASLQVLVDQDMTYTLALSNASGGPFAVVARHTCEVCLMNAPLPGFLFWTKTPLTFTFTLPSGAAAAFVKLTVTWSANGGIGGCADLCASPSCAAVAPLPGCLTRNAPLQV